MARFEHLVFVCTNEREPTDPRSACRSRGGGETLERLKGLVRDAGLKGRVRVVGCGCLDACATGPTVLVQSRGALGETWYEKVSAADAEELVQTHLQRGERVARLVNPRFGG